MSFTMEKKRKEASGPAETGAEYISALLSLSSSFPTQALLDEWPGLALYIALYIFEEYCQFNRWKIRFQRAMRHLQLPLRKDPWDLLFVV